MPGKRTPRDLLTPAALHILMALAGSELHGYGIKREVERRTGGRLRLGAGTLYEAVHRMEADGWIRETRASQEGGGRKKVYEITARGRSAMEEELGRLAGIVDFARDEDLLPADLRGGGRPGLAPGETG